MWTAGNIVIQTRALVTQRQPDSSHLARPVVNDVDTSTQFIDKTIIRQKRYTQCQLTCEKNYHTA